MSLRSVILSSQLVLNSPVTYCTAVLLKAVAAKYMPKNETCMKSVVYRKPAIAYPYVLCRNIRHRTKPSEEGLSDPK